MAKIVWTEESIEWLKKIHNYISNNDSTVVNKLIENIIEETLLLENFPDIGFLYKRKNNVDIRCLIYGHYKIANFKKNNVVEILGVFHDKMALDNYL